MNSRIITKAKNSIWILVICLKIQIKILLKNKIKSLIMIFCIFSSILLSIFIGFPFVAFNNIKYSTLNYIKPYNSFINVQKYKYIYKNDPYYGDGVDSPPKYISFAKIENDRDKSENNEYPFSLHFKPQNDPDAKYNESSYSMATYNYNNLKQYRDYVNIGKTISPALNPNHYLNIYNLSLTNNEFPVEIPSIVTAISKLYLNLIEHIGIYGLGGFIFNRSIVTSAVMLDSYSYSLFVKNKNLTHTSNLVNDNWNSSKSIASLIANFLLNANNLPAAHKVFDKFKKGTESNKQYTNDPYLQVKLGFGSLILDIIQFFAPYWIKNSFCDNYDQIINSYNAFANNKQAKKFNLGFTIDDTLKSNPDYNKKILSFDSVPYDSSTDSLVTQLNGNLENILNYKNIGSVNLFGLAKNNKILYQYSNLFNDLQENGAFATSFQKTNNGSNENNFLHTGLSKDDPVPIVINQATKKLYNLQQNQVIYFCIKRRLTTSSIPYSKVPDPKPPAPIAETQNVYAKVVGITNSYGKPTIFTSRQEANDIIFTRKSENRKYIDKKQQIFSSQTETSNVSSDTYDTFVSKSEKAYLDFSNKNNYETLQSPVYGDGNGYFNAVFSANNKSLFWNNFVMSLSNNTSLSNIGNVNYGYNSFYDNNLVKNTLSQIFSLTVIMFYFIDFVLLVVSIILLILSQRIIILQNQKQIAALKVLGYSPRRILFVTNSFNMLIIMCTVILVFCLVFPIGLVFQFILEKFFSISKEYYVIQSFYHLIIIIPFCIIILLFIFSYIYFAIRGIKKSKPIDIIGN